MQGFYPLFQAPPMRHNATQRSLRETLDISLREPAGLVCAALVLALVTVILQIAAVW